MDRLLERINDTPLHSVEEWLQIVEDEAGAKGRKSLIDLFRSGLIYLDENQKVRCGSIAGQGVGQFNQVKKHFGFVDGKEDSLFIPSKYFNGAMDKDLVLVQQEEDAEHGTHGRILCVLDHGLTQLVGTLYKSSGNLLFQALDTNISGPLPFDNPKNLSLKDNLRVLASISSYQPLRVCLKEVLGNQNKPGVDILSILYQYNLPLRFSSEVKKEARAIYQVVDKTHYPDRLDLTDRCVFTIDGPDTKDIDDAVSIERLGQGFRLGVHIADVSHYVTPGSALDNAAYERTSSLYVVDRVVPMLPVELSNGVCSLNPNVDRLCLSALIDFDAYGTIVDFTFKKTIIASRQRLDYREVNRFFDNPRDVVYIEESVQEALLIMKELSKLLKISRIANGAIEFDTPESEFVVDNKGKILDIRPQERGQAQDMIEDFMIAANQCAAKVMLDNHYPSLYRIHGQPPVEKLQALSTVLKTLGYRIQADFTDIQPMDISKILLYFRKEAIYPMVSSLVLRSQAKAAYSCHNQGHFGLALNYYSHFTAPIRRYNDIVVHRMIKNYMLSDKVDKSHIAEDEGRCCLLGEWISQQERVILEATREVEAYKKAEFMKRQIGKKFVGLISGVTKKGLFVQLENTCEGFIKISDLDDYYLYNETSQSLYGTHTKQTYRMGQPLKIRVAGVDMAEVRVNFVLSDKATRDQEPKDKKRKKKKRYGQSKYKTDRK